jgi:hypothetical protein
MPLGMLGPGRYRSLRLVEIAKDGLGTLEQEAALLRQGEAARAPLDQSHAETLLHAGEAPAQGRQGTLAAACGLRQAAGRYDAQEQAQIIEVVQHYILPFFGRMPPTFSIYKSNAGTAR